MNAKAPAVMIESASKWYGEVIGLNDVSLAIDGGVTGVLGPNGAGKSTLFKLLLGRPVSYTHLTLPTNREV